MCQPRGRLERAALSHCRLCLPTLLPVCFHGFLRVHGLPSQAPLSVPQSFSLVFCPFLRWTCRLPLEVRLDLGNIEIKKLLFLDDSKYVAQSALIFYTALKMCNSISSPVSKLCPLCVSIAYLGTSCGSSMFRAAYEETDVRFS